MFQQRFGDRFGMNEQGSALGRMFGRPFHAGQMQGPMTGGGLPPSGYNSGGINPGGMYTGGPGQVRPQFNAAGQFGPQPLMPMTGGYNPPQQSYPTTGGQYPAQSMGGGLAGLFRNYGGYRY